MESRGKSNKNISHMYNKWENNEDERTNLISEERAAELVASLKDFKDRDDLFDFFCIHFAFKNHEEINHFRNKCKLTSPPIKLACRECQQLFNWDEGFRKDWCCEDCWRQSYGIKHNGMKHKS